MPSDFDQIAANPPGAQDSIPELENLRAGLQAAMGGRPQLQGTEETERALENTRKFQATLVAHNKMNEQVIPPNSMTMNSKDRTVDIKGLSIDTYEAIMRDRQELNEIRGAFAQEAQRLQVRQRVAEGQPWMQLATALSANLAQAPDMPGWVRAAGRTSAQLNPTADELRNQRLAVLGKQADISEKAGALDIAAARTLEEGGMRGQSQADRIEAQRLKKVEDARNNVVEAIKVGEGRYDPKVATDLMQKAGATPEEIQSSLANFGMLASNAGAAYAAKRADVTEQQRLAREEETRRQAVTQATVKALTTKTGEKAEADEALDIAAQGLAAGDLTTIRSISSLRTDQRLRLYARVKKLDPNFNTAEVDRKVKMVDSFTNGKDGQGIQSFGTFLEHAGETADVLKGMYQSGSPAFNKPMNWIRKNMAGDPDYQRLIVSLEPVGKEFESFLLNQRALYVDDRKQIETMLNGNSSPKQIMAALNQMGKTAKDRYVEMNQRYKRVMKQDIEDPFGPDAIAGAAKVGITLPSGTQPPAVPSSDPLEGRTATGPNGKKIIRRNGQWVPM